MMYGTMMWRPRSAREADGINDRIACDEAPAEVQRVMGSLMVVPSRLPE
jgi:hypothetical protein